MGPAELATLADGFLEDINDRAAVGLWWEQATRVAQRIKAECIQPGGPLDRWAWPWLAGVSLGTGRAVRAGQSVATFLAGWIDEEEQLSDTWTTRLLLVAHKQIRTQAAKHGYRHDSQTDTQEREVAEYALLMALLQADADEMAWWKRFSQESVLQLEPYL